MVGYSASPQGDSILLFLWIKGSDSWERLRKDPSRLPCPSYTTAFPLFQFCTTVGTLFWFSLLTFFFFSSGGISGKRTCKKVQGTSVYADSSAFSVPPVPTLPSPITFLFQLHSSYGIQLHLSQVSANVPSVLAGACFLIWGQLFALWLEFS